jgi:hypothetical protein
VARELGKTVGAVYMAKSRVAKLLAQYGDAVPDEQATLREEDA